MAAKKPRLIVRLYHWLLIPYWLNGHWKYGLLILALRQFHKDKRQSAATYCMPHGLEEWQ